MEIKTNSLYKMILFKFMKILHFYIKNDKHSMIYKQQPKLILDYISLFATNEPNNM